MYENGTHSIRTDCAHALASDRNGNRDEHQALRRLVQDSLKVLTGRSDADPCVNKEDAAAIGTIGALMYVAANTNRLTEAVEAATIALRATTPDSQTDHRWQATAPAVHHTSNGRTTRTRTRATKGTRNETSSGH